MDGRADEPAVKEAIFTDHSLLQMGKRQVSPETARDVLSAPEAILPVRPGRVVAQKIVTCPGGKRFLLRVFVVVDRKPAEVVTVYRTSKIEKYRSRP